MFIRHAYAPGSGDPYNFDIKNHEDELHNTQKINPKLIRIQNNSFLNERHINKIINSITSLTNWLKNLEV